MIFQLDGRHLESSAEGIKRVDALFTRLNALAKGHPALSEYDSCIFYVV